MWLGDMTAIVDLGTACYDVVLVMLVDNRLNGEAQEVDRKMKRTRAMSVLGSSHINQVF